ncbi:hypothetical protein [Hymenobacter sp. B81]|uniref:hypothetical protein n=1 Tax=Hymenobacter sp. B81 TaxID=3344878 RepID=UPI0037DDA2C5
MIFFGTKASLAGTRPLPGVTCVSCGNNALNAAVYSRYFHIYWIPTFPLKRTGMSVCSFCKQALEPTEMPASYQAPFQAAQASVGLPLKHFTGLFLIGALVLIVSLVGFFKS